MTTTLKELAKSVKLVARLGEIRATDLDEWQEKAFQWGCTLHYQGRRYSFDYFMGEAHKTYQEGQWIPTPPTVGECLDSLLSDAQAGEQSFDEFCGDFGYDTDSRKHRKTWKSCGKTAKGLRRLLGEDFDAFMAAERE